MGSTPAAAVSSNGSGAFLVTMTDTKTRKVKNHLLAYGEITSWEAIENYRATRLASIIFNLRKDGWDIRTIMIEDTDKYGDTMRYAKYVLKGRPE